MKRILFLSAFCLPAIISFSQVKDAGLWLSARAEYNFSLELSAELTEEFRFNENISELGTHFSDAGVSYKFFKSKFMVSGHYRFIQKRRVEDTYSKRHRWYLDLSFSQKAGPLSISLRTRYQSQYADIFTSEDGEIPSYTWRNKLTLRFDTQKKFLPFISAELFTDVDGRINENVRYTLGLDYKMNNVHQFSAFFLHQREFNVADPYWDYIWGIGYSVALDYLVGNKPE